MDKTMYGIWIKGEGWLTVHDKQLTLNNVVAFDNQKTAKMVARWFGGRVFPVDKSLVELQAKMVEAEGRNIWQRFKNLFKRNS